MSLYICIFILLPSGSATGPPYWMPSGMRRPAAWAAIRLGARAAPTAMTGNVFRRSRRFIGLSAVLAAGHAGGRLLLVRPEHYGTIFFAAVAARNARRSLSYGSHGAVA